MFTIPLLLLVISTLAAWRLYSILPRRHSPRPARRDPSQTCSMAVFLGSGGHTSEALAMISGVDFARYQPRRYIISEGDTLSARKAVAFEESTAAGLHSGVDPSIPKPYRILTIPRARRVHQSLVTTPISTLISLLSCIYYVTIAPTLNSEAGFADVMILNGPGTCLPLCLAVYLNKFLGLHAPAIVYVESFARVKSLSLSGKLIRPLADRFIVQWPQLLQDQKSGECYGCLV